MERYDLTELTMKKLRDVCISGPYRERVIEYFLTNNYINILGNNILTKENGEVTTKIDNSSPVLEITSIYSDPINVKVRSINDEVGLIVATSDNHPLFTIKIDDLRVTNNISFYRGDTHVCEGQEVTFENKDAHVFSLFREEDGELVYSGELTPLLAAHGDDEYFHFSSKMETEQKEEPSILKRIYDSLTDKSIVRVPTTKEIHNLSDFVDTIFDSLRTKLESTRVVKDVKVRKRVPDKKNKND